MVCLLLILDIPPLWGRVQLKKGEGEYFEDYANFLYKADVGDFQKTNSGYITSWVKTALVTQCIYTNIYIKHTNVYKQ